MDTIARMKAYVETAGKMEWRDYKRLTAGKNISNEDFRDFLNR
jgi:hypothetical protein